MLCVPAHAFEIVEFAATHRAMLEGDIEQRRPLQRSLDVLVQHLVTMAMGGGFDADTLYAQVRSTYAFHQLTEQEWVWALDFVTSGGQALHAYEDFQRVVKGVDNLHRVPSARIARRHRMSIGTIGGDTTMQVRWLSGGKLGMIEESFISRVDKGSPFLFAGRLLELVTVKDMTAYVRQSKRRTRNVPRWQGGRIPLSARLSERVLTLLEQWQQAPKEVPEFAAVDKLLSLQANWSVLPGRNQFLIEVVKLREGYSHYFYPFGGRLVNEGLATLIAWRVSQLQPITFSLSADDYGFELLSRDQVELDEQTVRDLFSTELLVEHLLHCINDSEIAKRQFRDIARIAGLVFQGYPGSGKSTRQIQASSSLIYDVLADYDSDNLLLDQARREILEQQLDVVRMKDTLEEIARKRVVIRQPERLTPLAFPLWADRLQTQIVSSENWKQRVERMLQRLEKAANKTDAKYKTKPNEPQ